MLPGIDVSLGTHIWWRVPSWTTDDILKATLFQKYAKVVIKLSGSQPFWLFCLLQDVKVITTHQTLHIAVLPFWPLSFRGLNRLSTVEEKKMFCFSSNLWITSRPFTNSVSLSVLHLCVPLRLSF